MKKQILYLVVLLLTTVLPASSQSRTVTGTVTLASDGSTVPGVNVILKGTATGTVTDADGRYSVEIPEGAVLVFSFVGLKTEEITVGSRSVLNVEMASETSQLSEVVVTAIGIEREKRALGYAVTNLDNENIAQKSEPDAVRSLQGKVPGVQVLGSGGVAGSSTNITIRGNSSLTGNNQPLFVVDGVPFNNDVNASTSFTGGNQYSNRAIDLDPNIIESVTVLKGAAAAALYGSRAANGVIVITTKGAAGASKKGLEISINSSLNVDRLAGVPDYTDKYGQGGANRFNRGFVGNWGPAFADVDSVAHPYSGGDAVDVFPEFAGKNIAYRPHESFEDFHRTGTILENAITVSTSNEVASLAATVSRLDQESMIPGNRFDRTSVNLGGRAQLQNGFFISSNISYVKSQQESPPLAVPGFGSSIYTRLVYTPRQIDLGSLPYTNPVTGGNVYYRDDQDNPYWLLENSGYTSLTNRYFGNVTIGYDITDWMTISYQAGFDAYTEERTSFVRKGSYETPLGSIFVDNYTFEQLDGVLLLNIEKEFGDDWSLSANIGHNANQRTFQRDAIQGTDFIVFGIDRINNTVNQTAFENYSQRRYHSVFLDATIGYKDYLFLNVVSRQDWSSTLPPGERSYFYPGASASFIFTEAFNLTNTFIDFGKLRAGYTQVGNEAAPYQTTTPYITNDAPSGQFAGNYLDFPFTRGDGQVFNNQLRSVVLGNASLKPEFTNELELGADLQLFNNRVGIDATYFNRRSTDQIVTASLAPSVGYTRYVTNIGEVVNKGWEIGLNLSPLDPASPVAFNLFTNFTRIRSEVVELADGLDQLFVAGFTDLQVAHFPGQPYGQLFGSRALRAEDGSLLINEETGLLIRDPELGIIGDPNPDFNLTFIPELKWKGFTLSVMVDWKKGGDIFSQSADQLISRGLTTYNDDRRDIPRVIPGYLATPTGEQILQDGQPVTNNIPVSVNELYFIDGLTWFDDLNVYDGSYVKIREVSLGYSLPEALLARTPFGSATITLSGRNLWWNAYNIPDALNFDPEVNTFGAGNAQGFEYLAAPTSRRYGVNLRFTF